MADTDKNLIASLRRDCGANLSPITAIAAVSRGLHDAESLRQFCGAGLDALTSPHDLPDVDSAVDRIRLAIQQSEKLRVFGDYDCDGITATALLVSVLSDLGADVDYRIPVRLTDGYGLDIAAVEQAAADGVNLLITADCGVTACEETDLAFQKGIDVIITDHHEPGAHLPGASAVVNPKRKDSNYPFVDLAGVGVCYQLCRALTGQPLRPFLDLVALGTVADVVPLLGENRILVREGIKALRKGGRPGLVALAQQAGTDIATINAEDLAFRVAPRVNAPGRLDDAAPLVALMLTRDGKRAAKMARRCEEANSQRKRITERVLAEAQVRVESTRDDRGAAIVLWDDHWHPGVLGLVASRLCEQYRRPTILLTRDAAGAGILKGSGRSIAGFSLFSALRRCSEHLEQFGGHDYAAGMSVTRESVAAFARAINEVASEGLAPENVIRTVDIDAEVPLKVLDRESVEQLEELGPFGAGNPRPRFLARDVQVQDWRQLGEDHVSLMLKRRGLRVIGFRKAHEWRAARSPRSIDIVFSPVINRWKRKTNVQLVLEDFRPSGDEGGELRQAFRRRWLFLRRTYPPDEELRVIYRRLRTYMTRDAVDPAAGEIAAAADGPGGLFEASEEAIDCILKRNHGLDERSLYCALEVFSELGLMSSLSQGGRRVWVLMPDPSGALELEASDTYRRGRSALQEVEDVVTSPAADPGAIARALYGFYPATAGGEQRERDER